VSLCSQIDKALHNKITQLIEREANNSSALLDIGCWDGKATCEYGAVANTSVLAGVEVFPDQALMARQRGIDVAEVNLESDPFPWASQTFDLVVCNQVFEHLKNIFHPIDEIARLLKPGGKLVISVPNLASLHNRVMLLLGLQPSSIRIFGPHVRGYAMKEFTEYLKAGGLFEVRRIEGVEFYPFPAAFPGNQLAAVWKGACHTPIWLLERTENTGCSFSEAYASRSEQTHM
jgi:SAM-dependent methyltransferase